MLPAGLLEHPACGAIAPYLARLAAFERWPSVLELDARFADRLRLPPAVSLELQTPARRSGRAAIYEVRIHAERRIPTREGSWHDLMNLLIWAAFPRSKRMLSARQHAIATARVAADATKLPGARTREQDALAMLDEGGALLVAPSNEPIELAAPADIYRAIGEGRIRLILFGHALLEAIATSELERRDLRGAVEVLRADPHAPLDEIDALLAARIETPGTFERPDPARSLWLRDAFTPGSAGTRGTPRRAAPHRP